MKRNCIPYDVRESIIIALLVFTSATLSAALYLISLHYLVVGSMFGWTVLAVASVLVFLAGVEAYCAAMCMQGFLRVFVLVSLFPPLLSGLFCEIFV
jgi:hypothetical protein